MGRGHVVLGALVVVATFAWGVAFYGLGYYMLRLRDLRDWQTGEISNIIFGFYALAVVLSFLVSKQLARRGSAPVLLVGAGALGVALFAMPHVSTLWALALVFVALSVGWSATNTNTISTTVMAWFPDGQRELSLALIGASIGGIVLVPLVAVIDDVWGFTTAMTALGLASILGVGGAGLLTMTLGSPPPRRTTTGSPDRIAWSLLGGSDYWIVGTGLALGIVVQAGFLVHQLSLLAETVSDTAAARIVGLATLAALVGRLGPIAIGARRSPTTVGAAYLLMQVVGLVGLATFEHTTTSITLFSMVFGLGVGVLITMPSLLTRATYPDIAYTSAYPVVNLSFQVPLVLGAPLVAQLEASLEGYRNAMWVLAVLDLASVWLIIVHHRRLARRPAPHPVR